MSTNTGQQAEEMAAQYLGGMDFKILGRNVRTRWSEIDIVAEKNARIHFVEVKFRRSAAFGSGAEYITADKQRRLRQAAAAWMVMNAPEGDYQIDVITVTGNLADPEFDYLPDIIN